jgi:hypothetical protein
MKKIFNIVTYKKNGIEYIRGSIKGYNLIWNERIDRDGYHCSFINITNNIKLKKDIINLNNLIDYNNNNNVKDIFIYMNNPNIKLLLNNLQQIKKSNEELNIRNISIDNYDIIKDFYIKNNLYKESSGMRTVVLSSFYIDRFNYNKDKLTNIIDFIKKYYNNKKIELKPSFIYNDIIKDDILEYNFNKIYNINIDILDLERNIINKFISNKIEKFYILLFSNVQTKEYNYNNYILNIYIKWDHFVEQYENESLINKLNIDILNLKKKYKFNFNIYLPTYIKYLLKTNISFIKYY